MIFLPMCRPNCFAFPPSPLGTSPFLVAPVFLSLYFYLAPPWLITIIPSFSSAKKNYLSHQKHFNVKYILFFRWIQIYQFKQINISGLLITTCPESVLYPSIHQLFKIIEMIKHGVRRLIKQVTIQLTMIRVMAESKEQGIQICSR